VFFIAEFQKIQRELEHLNKLYLAYKFVCAEEASVKSDEELNLVINISIPMIIYRYCVTV
jgi:hypothetical protein